MLATISPTNITILQLAFTFLLVIGFQLAVARLQIGQEAKRRWQHGLTGHFFVSISYLFPLEFCIPALLLGSFGLYYLRLHQTDLFFRFFGPLLRPHEKEGNQLPGAFFFLLGTAMTASLFPLNTARYAVECLAIADPVAAWIGRSIPSLQLNSSASLAGSLACFVTAWLIGNLYLSFTWQAVVGAVACCVAEALPVGNDNLLIPLVTAAAVHYCPFGS